MRHALNQLQQPMRRRYAAPFGCAKRYEEAMKLLITIIMISFCSFALANECNEKMDKYLTLSESDPTGALQKYIADEDNCEDRDVLIGTLYVASGDLESGERFYKKSIEEEKALAFAYWQLAGLELSKSNLQGVIDYCQESLKHEKNYMCYRHSAIALTAAGRHDLVPDYFGVALKLNSNALSDTDLMSAVAFSYTELGKYELAKGAITLGIQNNPDAKSNPMFVQAYKNWKEKSGQ
jgi:tetratricopeptide (TPR) repeat protein